MKKKLLQIILCFNLMGSSVPLLHAQALVEDPTFSVDGMMTLNLAGGGAYFNTGKEIIVLPDGRIVIAGHVIISSVNYFAIARLNSDGTFDTTFDSDGYRLDNISIDGSTLGDLALQSDGKLVAVGSLQTISDKDFVVVRYNTDGSLDNTFAVNGVLTVDPNGYDDEGLAISVQNDGKLVIAGNSFNLSGETDVTVIRINADGTLDPSFNSTGFLISDVAGGDDVATDILALDDSRVLVSGYSFSGVSTNDDFLLISLNSDGTFDNTFGVSGVTKTNVGSASDRAQTIAIQDDNKILMSGQIWVYTGGEWNTEIGIVRYNEDGTLDNTFSGDGKFVTPMIGTTTSFDMIYSTIVDPDGKILLGGGSLTNDYSMYTFVILRLNANGTLDDTFEGDGFYESNNFSFGYIDDFVFQPDGKLIALGTASSEFAIVRYNFVNDLNVGPDYIDLGTQVYPNPSTGLFNLEFNHSSSIQSIQLYNAAGDLILSNDGLKDLKQLTIDIQNHADGFYFLHIISDVGVEVLKLSKIVG
jgi:uncharacterized delta-60 repeat protein